MTAGSEEPSPSQPAFDEGAYLVCPIEDWRKRDHSRLFAIPAVVAVASFVAVVVMMQIGYPGETYSFWIAAGTVGVFGSFAGCWLVGRRADLRESARRRSGSLASRFRARERLARLRGRRGWARLARSWPGARAVLIGLRPDPAQLGEVQVFEPIDVSTAPREFASARGVKYRDIHVTSLLLAFAAAGLARWVFGAGMSGWVIWFLPMLPVAWVLVWLYRRRRISSLGTIAPIQLASTVVEPGRVTRTVLGSTREFESDSGLLLVRAMSASPKRHLKAQPTEIPVRLTLINGRGQRSSITVRGADHPTIADVLARWVHPTKSVGSAPSADSGDKLI